MSSDNGQLSPAASNRRIVNRTVDGAVPIRRAISRVGIPADFNLITSRTWRMASLSVGIQVPLRKAERRTVAEPEEASSSRATSSRNGGRDQIGTVGEIIPEWWATSSGISTVLMSEMKVAAGMAGGALRVIESNRLDERPCERAYRPDLMERDLKILAEIDKRIEKTMVHLVSLKEYKKLYTKEVKPLPAQAISPPAKQAN
jgi:hypothetical protein